MNEPDWNGLIEPVARQLWGEPNKGLSTKLSLRWGNGGSRAVFLDGGGNWKDFESGEEGGVLALVMREQSADKAGALNWLADNGFIERKDSAAAPEKPASSRSAPPASEPQMPVDEPQGTPVAVKGYHYTDGDGNLLYDVVRYHFRKPDGSWVLNEKTGNPKKTFKQRRPDGKGGWMWNLDGIGHTLYRRQQLEIAIAEGKTVFLPEGEKDAETLIEWGIAATTNSGGAQNWRPHHAEMLRGADVVILGDDDPAGRKRVETVGTSLRGIAKRIRAITSWGGPKDVTDWKEQAGGTAEQLSAKIGELPDWRQAPPVSKFNAVKVGDAAKSMRRHTWLVQDMIELRGTCAFAGFSLAGKSFLMLKLALCVALGKPFFGRAVKQGLVIYQLGEGQDGFNKRLEGLLRDEGIEDRDSIPLIILPHRINLFASDDDTDALIEEANSWAAHYDMPLGMVVIDTYNKATRGMNEISGQDNGKVIDRIERITEKCRCTTMVVDHLAKNGGIRGHGSKTDDMTNTIRVEVDGSRTDRNGRQIRKMILSKNKDGETGTAIPFVLRQIVVGEDEHGSPITTCVVDPPDGDIEDEAKHRSMAMSASLLLRAVKDTADIEGQAAPPELVQVPPGRNVAKWDAVLERARKQWTFNESDPKKREAELRRIVKDGGNRLMLAGYIDRDNNRGLIWWTGKEDRPRAKPGEAKRTEQPKPSPYMTPADADVPF